MQKLVKCGLGQLAGLHRAGVEKEPGSDESGRLQRHYFGEPESARATQVCRLQLCSRNFTLCSHASTLNSCSVEVSTLSLLRRSSAPSALSSATHRLLKSPVPRRPYKLPPSRGLPPGRPSWPVRPLGGQEMRSSDLAISAQKWQRTCREET